MRELAIAILGLPDTMSQSAVADSRIAQVKRRLTSRAEEKTTAWELDREDEGEEAIYAESDIPDEAAKLRGHRVRRTDRCGAPQARQRVALRLNT